MADVTSKNISNTPKKASTSIANSSKSPVKKPSEVPGSVTSQVETMESNLDDKGNIEPETGTGDFENITDVDLEEEEEEEEEEEDDNMTEEAVPAGSVDHKGDVINDTGIVIGHVTGDKASDLEGSMVDQEGDVLDDEGNVIGSAHLNPEEISKPNSTLGVLEKPMQEINPKPEDTVSKIEQGGDKGTQPELVDASINEIGQEGDLKDKSGSAVGKPEVEPELPKDSDLLEDAQPRPDDKIDDASVIGSQQADQEKAIKDEEVDPVLGEEDDIEAAAGSPGELHEASDPELQHKLDVPEGGEGSEELKLDAVGNPIEIPENVEHGADGNSIDNFMESKPDTKEEPIVDEPKVDADGNPIEIIEELKLDANGNNVPEEPQVNEENPTISEGLKVDAGETLDTEEPKLDVDGKPITDEPILDVEGNPIPESEREKLDEGVALPEEIEKLDLSILRGKKVNKIGKIVDENGTPFGQLAEGDVKKLIGKKVDGDGNIWDDSGKIIGHAELLPEDEREAEPSCPFEDFPDSVLDAKGNVIFQGQIVGKLIEGDFRKLEGKKVDADGDVLDKNGNILGKAERYQEEEIVPEEVSIDLSLLDGKKVNKAGNVVDDNGKLFGRVVTGVLAKLVGKKCDAEGKIWGETGKIIGTAELIPAEDRDEASISEFEDFPGATCDNHGNIIYEGQIVGKLIEGDARKLVGKKIDQDGEIIDRLGNVLGRAERWIEEDAPPEPEAEVIDMSALAGKRVNKAGNVVDGHGDIYGILVEGDPKKLAGRMCDKNGDVFDEGGNIVGRAKLVPESERSGMKEGPFAGFTSPTVSKDGKVLDIKGVVIGRIIEGDAKMLYGKEVDSDGDVLDKNGNSVGRAERWEEEEKPKATSIVEGRKVNREGNVVDENGDLIAKLTEGEVTKCAGKDIDADGDVYNSKGQVIGHVTLLNEIPEPVVEPEPEPEPETEVLEDTEEEPQETEEEKTERLLKEQDRKLAGQMAMCIQGTLDNINPVLTMITDVSKTFPKVR
jgi:hypothetical protein